MANLLSWLGGAAKKVEQTIGGAVHGAEQAVQHVVQPVAQQVGQAVNNAGGQVNRAVQQSAPVVRNDAINILRGVTSAANNTAKFSNNTFAKPVFKGVQQVARNPLQAAGDALGAGVQTIPVVKPLVDSINQINTMQRENPKLQASVQQVVDQQKAIANKIPRINLQSNDPNQIVRGGLNMAAGIVNSTVNAPSDLAKATTGYTGNLLSQGTNHPDSFTKSLPNIAGSVEPILNVAGNFVGAGTAANLAKQGVEAVGKQGAKQVLVQGAKMGAKIGAQYGVASGALGALKDTQPNDNAGTIAGNTFMQAALGGATGAGAGAVLGAGGAGVGYGATKGVQGISALDKAAGRPLANQAGKSNLPTGGGKNVGGVDALKAEARKYKSADEFVDSHSPVYHGTNAALTDISQLQSGRQQLADLYNQAHTPKPTASNIPTIPGKGRVVPQPVEPMVIPSDPINPQTLNTNRLNISDAARSDVNALSAADTTAHLSNKEVEQLAKGAGVNTTSHSIDRQRQIIAEQLNLRKEIVTLSNQADELLASGNIGARADILRQIAEKGRTSTEQGSSIARQLQARRIIANELDTPMNRVFKLLDTAGIDPEQYTKVAATVDFNNPQDVIRFYRSQVPAKFKDWLDVVRYNSMLSSPLTQIVNIASTAGNIAMAPVEKTITGLLDVMRSTATGKERKYAVGEGASFVKGTVKSVPQAVRDFKGALKDLDTGTHANAGIEEGRVPIAVHGDNKALDVLSFPMHLLSAFDAANKALVRGGSDAGLALRETKGIKINGNKELINQGEAAYRTFNQDLGLASQGSVFRAMDEVTNMVMRARSSKNPVLRYPAQFTLPFVRIGANLFKTGTEYSPFGVATMPGAMNKTEQLSKAIMGTATMGLAAGLLGQGRLTWAAPTNPKQRAEFDAAGMQPYAVKIGGKWVGFAKLPPILSFNLAMVASLDDTIKYGKMNQDGLDNVLTAVAKYGNFLADQSYVKNLGDALSAAKGDQQAIAQLIGNYPQQVVPFRALSGWIATMTDDTQRKINTDAGFAEKQVQVLFNNIPGLRETNPAKLDNEGQPIPANNQLVNAFSPVKITNEVTAHAQNYADMKKMALDNANKKIANDQAVKDGTRTQGGTNIANGLSQDSKTTLTQYGKLSTEDKKKYTADTKNQYKLDLANYENDSKSGKLNDVQKQQKEKSLAKEAITSDYSKEVLDFYNLSNADKAAYFQRDPQKAKELYDNAKNMASRLADKGMTSKTVSTATGKKAAAKKVAKGKSTKGKVAKAVKLPSYKTAKFATPHFKVGSPKKSTFSVKKLPKYGSTKTSKVKVV